MGPSFVPRMVRVGTSFVPSHSLDDLWSERQSEPRLEAEDLRAGQQMTVLF